MNADGAYNVKPLLPQIWTALVEYHAKRAPVGKCRQHVSNQLVRQIDVVRLREFVAAEYNIEVAVSLDYGLNLLLKIAFGELGLDQQRSELHVYFGAIDPSVCQRHTRPDTKARN